MSNLLRLTVLATVTTVLAANDASGNSGLNDFSLGVEVQGNLSNYSWAFAGNKFTVDAGTTTGNRGAVYIYDALSKFEHRYQNKANDVLNSFSAKLVGSYLMSDEVSLSVYAGVVSAATKGKALSQINGNNSYARVEGVAGELSDTPAADNVPGDIKAKSAIFAGARVLYNELGLAVQYDMSKFDVSGYSAASDLNKEYDDKQILFGFYGQSHLDLGGNLNVKLFIEGLSNFNQEADKISGFWDNHAAKTIYTNATTPEGNNYVSLGKVVSIVNKLSVGVGMDFANL